MAGQDGGGVMAAVEAGDHREQGERGHGEDDVATPGAVAPCLGMVEPNLIFSLLEIAFPLVTTHR